IEDLKKNLFAEPDLDHRRLEQHLLAVLQHRDFHDAKRLLGSPGSPAAKCSCAPWANAWASRPMNGRSAKQVAPTDAPSIGPQILFTSPPNDVCAAPAPQARFAAASRRHHR